MLDHDTCIWLEAVNLAVSVILPILTEYLADSTGILASRKIGGKKVFLDVLHSI